MPHERPKATGEFHCLPIDRYPVHASFLTDRGHVRPINEDSAAVVVPSDAAVLHRKGVLAVVADGMGGHEAGEIASGLAVSTVTGRFYSSRLDTQQALVEAFHAANSAILERARHDRKMTGMGTTCTAAVVLNGLVYTAHVGDSRIYLIRGGCAYRMTQDHSATMEMVNQGLITLAEANHHEDRNVILRAMGTHEKLDVSTWREPFSLQPGDALMLCSDGLYETINDDEFGRLCSANPTPERACVALMEMAASRDGTDNVTVAVVGVGSESAQDQGGGMTGRMVGNYRLIDKLGEGGMGKVYRAVDSMIEREVAIKALKPEIAAQPGTLERFRTEAVTLARLNHPAVAQLYSFFKDGDEYFMAMEFVPGESLETIIQRDGALSWPQALNYAIRMLEGIQHAHSLGVLHRDLKPANVMLTPSGAIKLTDFGIAQVLGAAKMTREGRMVGTLEYLAPERIQGKPADARSDIYSLGVLLYEMLSGRLPFQADSEYELLMAHVQQRPPSPRALGLNLPPPVESALLLALEKDPTQRYQNAASFAEALRALLPAGKATVLSEPVPKAPVHVAIDQRKIWMGAAAGLSLIALVSVGFALYRFIRPSPQPAPPQPVVQYEPPPEPAPAPRPSPILPAEESVVPPTPSQPPPAAPIHTQPPVTVPSKPATPPQKPITPGPLSPDVRRASLAALERTDGPATGPLGTYPLQLVGLVTSLKIGGPTILPEVAEIVSRRGVAFRTSPPSTQALRDVGATPEFLKVVEAGYRAPEVIASPVKTAVVAPEPVATPTPPVKTIRSLREVKTIFVEQMPSQLDEFIRDEIERQLSGRVEVARNRGGADALLTVVMEEQKGGAASGAGRLLGLKDKTRITTKVLDRVTRSVVWTRETGDRKAIVGAFQSDTSKRLAERVVKELKEAIN